VKGGRPVSSPIDAPAVPAAPLFETGRLAVVPVAPGGEAPLRAVFEASADFFEAVYGIPAPPPDAAERETAASAGQAGREVALLVPAAGGDPVGAMAWWTGNPEPDRALLGMLMVVPAARGRGLGREVLAGLEVWLAGRGIRAVRTAVQRRRHAVLARLAALGFAELPIAEHQKLGLAGAGLALFEKPVG
jgi:GNAT superfamily N-acetyltransferase